MSNETRNLKPIVKQTPSRYRYVIEIPKTFGGLAPCMQRIAQGKDFELILTVKMETRHPAA